MACAVEWHVLETMSPRAGEELTSSVEMGKPSVELGEAAWSGVLGIKSAVLM
jgi:hypothetical protein